MTQFKTNLTASIIEINMNELPFPKLNKSPTIELYIIQLRRLTLSSIIVLSETHAHMVSYQPKSVCEKDVFVLAMIIDQADQHCPVHSVYKMSRSFYSTLSEYDSCLPCFFYVVSVLACPIIPLFWILN